MSRALVVVIKGSGLVLAGMTRNAGGPVPPVRDLTGDRLDVTIAGAPFPDMPVSALDVVEVAASETDVLRCAGTLVKVDGDSTRLTTPLLSFATPTWDAQNEQLTVKVPDTATLELTILDGQGTLFTSLVTLTGGAGKVLDLRGAVLPIAVMADDYNPASVT